LKEPFKFARYSPTETKDFVYTGLGQVGPTQKKLAEPVVKLISKRTGIEYNVPASAVEKRLATDPGLVVVSPTKRRELLYAVTNPLAIFDDGFRLFTGKPSFVTSQTGGVGGSTGVMGQPTSVFRNPLQNLRVTPVFSTSFTGVGEKETVLTKQREIQQRSFLLGSKSLSGLGVLDFTRSKLGVKDIVVPLNLVGSKSAVRSAVRVDTSLKYDSSLMQPVITTTFTPIRDVPSKPFSDKPPRPTTIVKPWLELPERPDRKRSVPFKPVFGVKKIKGRLKTALPGSDYILSNVPSRGDVFFVDNKIKKEKKRKDLDLFGGAKFGL
jgi:hypothetical protein